MRAPRPGDECATRGVSYWTPCWFSHELEGRTYFRIIRPMRPGGDLSLVCLWPPAEWRFADDPRVSFNQPCPECQPRVTHRANVLNILQHGFAITGSPKQSKDCDRCMGRQVIPWHPFQNQPISREIDAIIGWR